MSTRTRFGIILGLLALFGMRFLAIDLAPFNIDEASLQIAARDHAGIPWLGLPGSAGLRYGPTGIWFYSVLQFIHPSLSFALWIHAFLYGVGFLLQGLTLERVLRRKILAPYLVVAWSAPLFWVASRTLWDNSLQIFLFGLLGALLWLVHPSESKVRSLFRTLAVGVTCGLLINLHLMTAPLVIFWIGFAMNRKRITRTELVATLVTGSLLVVPYLIAAFSSPRPDSVIGKPLWHFFHRLLAMPILLPGLGLAPRVEYFLDHSWTDVAGAWGLVWSDLGLGGVLQVAGLLLGISAFFRRDWEPGSKAFVLGSLGVYVLFVAALRLLIHIHPHYSNPVYGFVPLIWVLAGEELGRRLPRFRWIRWIVPATNLGAILFLLHFIDLNHGIRSGHYGSSLREMKRASQLACSADPETQAPTRSLPVPIGDLRIGIDQNVALRFVLESTSECTGNRAAASLLPFKLARPDDPFSAELTLSEPNRVQ